MNKFFIVSGPSGSGKSTLIKHLISIFGDKLVFCVSTTSRSLRANEINSIDYHFVSKEKFEQMIENKELIEYQEIYGNYYGLSKNEVEKILSQNKSPITDIDVYGKVNVDKTYPDNIGILILPPSQELLKNRLVSRNRDSLEEIEKRIKIAKQEVDFAVSNGNYKYQLENDCLDITKKRIEEIVRGELSK